MNLWQLADRPWEMVERELLTESGSIFVQIGDENVHRVRGVLDEVFDSKNFVSQITFKKTGGQSSAEIAGVTASTGGGQLGRCVTPSTRR